MHVTHMEIEWLAHLESTNGRLAQAGVLSPKLLYISRAASYFYDTDCKIFFSGFGSDGSKGKGPCSSVSWNHFHTQLFWLTLNFFANSERLLRPCPNVSTTPLRQWGFRQCLPFSWTTLRGKLNILLEGSLMWLERLEKKSIFAIFDQFFFFILIFLRQVSKIIFLPPKTRIEGKLMKFGCWELDPFKKWLNDLLSPLTARMLYIRTLSPSFSFFPLSLSSSFFFFPASRTYICIHLYTTQHILYVYISSTLAIHEKISGIIWRA